SRLITSSVGRAYEYVNEINSERFIEGTNVLRPYYFQRILENKQKAFQELQIPFVQLEVLTIDHSAENLQNIGSLLRMNDHLGYDESDQLFILLSNATKEDATFVIRRFQSKGILVVLQEEEAVINAG
ncbi:hypothetical protein, partial [Metabacillus litoralis]|uniref:hypothetical protein n=1 Tax=Metabacillus litoralis TaxID=152268 RepID=UPI0019616BFF